MASIPCTFQGVLFFSDLGIGGGPMPGGPYPDQGLPGKPPGFWGGVAPPHPDQGLPGSQPHPSHPIAPGGRPPGIWGGPPMYPDQGLPGKPPGIWGGAPPYPDQGLPGQGGGGGGGGGGNFPSQGPGFPTNPIVIPPDAIAPGVPSHPIYWPIQPPGGPSGPETPPTAEHPIVIPGDDEQSPKFEVKTAWSPQTGWIVVVVPGEDATVPTPSQ